MDIYGKKISKHKRPNSPSCHWLSMEGCKRCLKWQLRWNKPQCSLWRWQDMVTTLCLGQETRLRDLSLSQATYVATVHHNSIDWPCACLPRHPWLLTDSYKPCWLPKIQATRMSPKSKQYFTNPRPRPLYQSWGSNAPTSCLQQFSCPLTSHPVTSPSG